MAVNEEYPKMPCKEKGLFSEPIIIKVVAVISKIIPIETKRRTVLVMKCLRCSVRTPIE